MTRFINWIREKLLLDIHPDVAAAYARDFTSLSKESNCSRSLVLYQSNKTLLKRLKIRQAISDRVENYERGPRKYVTKLLVHLSF